SNIDSYNRCGHTYPAAADPAFSTQVSCDSGLLASCPPLTVANYPKATTITLTLPPPQQSMPRPCAGVPADPWCSGAVSVVRGCVRSGATVHVPATLAPGERLARFTARIRPKGRLLMARHGLIRARLLGGSHARVSVGFLEQITVHGRA